MSAPDTTRRRDDRAAERAQTRRARRALSTVVGSSEADAVIELDEGDRLRWLLELESNRWLPAGDYWALVRALWLLAERTASECDLWLQVLGLREGRRSLTSAAGHRRLATLPREVVVFRGHAEPNGGGYAPAWTLDQGRAETFADAAADITGNAPIVEAGWVPRREIVAYFSPRDVIVPPGLISGRQPVGALLIAGWVDAPK